jgi:hypothetical protein
MTKIAENITNLDENISDFGNSISDPSRQASTGINAWLKRTLEGVNIKVAPDKSVWVLVGGAFIALWFLLRKKR